jgi:hypothetical protein
MAAKKKTKRCPHCEEVKPSSQFGKHKGRKDGLQAQCKPCRASYRKKRYQTNPQVKEKLKKVIYEARARNQAYALEHLRNNPCVGCGEDDVVLLDFDHVRGVKKRNVSDLIRTGASIERLQEEIDKCDVTCVVCHRRKTARDFNYYRCRAQA